MAGSDRSRADPALILALASGKTVGDAAAEAHVSERTVRRRLHEPEFLQALGQARAARADRIADRSAEYLNAALGQLARYLLDDVTNPTMGMSAGTFHLRRMQAIAVLARLHLACRAIYRDEEIRELRATLESLEREVQTFHEL